LLLLHLPQQSQHLLQLQPRLLAADATPAAAAPVAAPAAEQKPEEKKQ